MGIKELLPFIKILLSKYATMPRHEQSAIVHNVERILAGWFQQKKMLVPMREDESKMVMMIEERNGVLMDIPVMMYQCKNDSLSKAIAHYDVAMRNYASHVSSTDAARGDEIRQSHDLIAGLLKLCEKGYLVNRVLPEHGINITNMSQSIPAFAMLVPFLAMIPEKEGQQLSEEQWQQVAGIILSILQEAARLPECRLVPPKPTHDPRLALQTAAPEVPVEPLQVVHSEQKSIAEAVVEETPDVPVDALGAKEEDQTDLDAPVVND